MSLHFFYIAKIFESVEKILKGDLSMHPHRYNFCTVDLITFDVLGLFYKMGYERFSTLIYRQVVRMKVCSVCQLRDILHLTKQSITQQIVGCYGNNKTDQCCSFKHLSTERLLCDTIEQNINTFKKTF